jgi:hypothetical protein
MPICKKPRKKVIRGVDVHRESLENANSTFISPEIRDLGNSNQKKNYLLNVSDSEMVLGREIKYVQIVREFKLLYVEGLREVTIKNKMQYRKDRRKKKDNNIKEGNGYG